MLNNLLVDKALAGPSIAHDIARAGATGLGHRAEASLSVSRHSNFTRGDAKIIQVP